MLHINLKYISLPLIERDLKGKKIDRIHHRFVDDNDI